MIHARYLLRARSGLHYIGYAEGDDAGGDDPNDKPTISQNKLNQLLAENKRQLQQQNAALVKQLETIKQSANMTEQQRSELESQIKALKDQYLTVEEKAKQEREALERELKQKEAALTQERDTWRGRYTQATISRSITDAAVAHDAFNPAQIVALIGPNTSLDQEIDKDGKPTGQLVPITKFVHTDSKGEQVTLSLAPLEAVKKMKDIEGYQNLFKSQAKGGAGAQNYSSAKDQKNPPKDPAAYREWRKTHGI